MIQIADLRSERDLSAMLRISERLDGVTPRSRRPSVQYLTFQLAASKEGQPVEKEGQLVRRVHAARFSAVSIIAPCKAK